MTEDIKKELQSLSESELENIKIEIDAILEKLKMVKENE